MQEATGNNHLRNTILSLVGEYNKEHTRENKFIPGKTPIHYAGRIYNEKEMQAAVEASLDFWLTEGRFTEQFESHLASAIGAKHAILVNSGSSANLLALTALTSPLLGYPQPAHRNITCRQIGDLPNADRIMNAAFFLGIYRGSGRGQVDYTLGNVDQFLLLRETK
jgi:dTDP-4-amino-4,6-dideoxygalactose transaminase